MQVFKVSSKMKIAVLSGKGGAGKTFVSTNLAAVANQSVYVDCDVEEPNGRLFFKPEDVTKTNVYTYLPVFDEKKCTGCRKCVDFCKFNALVFIKDKPLLFPEVCHSCGGCSLVCKENAIEEKEKAIGIIEQGYHRHTKVITGVLNLGEASGVAVIAQALKSVENASELIIIDCPPGSACSVIESIEGADYCIFVVEPTAFGFHNFCMVYELVTLLQKPCGIIINKMDSTYQPLENFCVQHNVPILLRIPFSQKLAQMCSEGKLASEEDEKTAQMFRHLLEEIGGAPA